jgi:hypothetical protein
MCQKVKNPAGMFRGHDKRILLNKELLGSSVPSLFGFFAIIHYSIHYTFYSAILKSFQGFSLNIILNQDSLI